MDNQKIPILFKNSKISIKIFKIENPLHTSPKLTQTNLILPSLAPRCFRLFCSNIKLSIMDTNTMRFFFVFVVSGKETFTIHKKKRIPKGKRYSNFEF